MSEDKLESPEGRKKKKVALVDIDGCLLINGKLNLDLVQRLREGGYDEIILFTQRSKFVQSLNLPQHIMAGSELKSTADAVSHLSNALDGRVIKVSTSVDFMFGKPFAYVEQLKPIEELILANANNIVKLRSHESNLQKIEELGRALATANESEVDSIKQEISYLKKLLLSQKELEEIERKQAELKQEIEKEKLAVAKYQSEHPEYITTDKEGYPVNKQQQLINLRQELTQGGFELEEDYFDDNYLNLLEFEELDNKPNRFMVSEGRIMSFEQVGHNLDKINTEIAKLRSEYEGVIKELGLDVTTAVNMSPQQKRELKEPKKTAVTNLQKLNDIQETIQTHSQKSLGAGLDIAEFFMSKKSTTQNIPVILEALEKIKNLQPFLDDLDKTKAELSSLKTAYERVIKDKLGIKVPSVYEMVGEQIQKLKEPHQTAVTNLQALNKMQTAIEKDAGEFYMTKESYSNVQELKESLKAIYIKAVYEPANLKNPREHEAQYEVTTNTVTNASEQFKHMYQDVRGDVLKTRILSDFKSKIEEFTTAQEIEKYLKEYKDTPEYKTLATGQGAFTRTAHQFYLERFVTTSSVKAVNQIVKDAVEKIEEQSRNAPKT